MYISYIRNPVFTSIKPQRHWTWIPDHCHPSFLRHSGFSVLKDLLVSLIIHYTIISPFAYRHYYELFISLAFTQLICYDSHCQNIKLIVD